DVRGDRRMTRPQRPGELLRPFRIAAGDGDASAESGQFAADVTAEGAVPAEDDRPAHGRPRSSDRAASTDQRQYSPMVGGVAHSAWDGAPVNPAADRSIPQTKTP